MSPYFVPRSDRQFTQPAQGSPVMASTATPTSQLRLARLAPMAALGCEPRSVCPKTRGLPRHSCPPPTLTEVPSGVTFLSLGRTQFEGRRTCHSGISSHYDYRRMSLPHSMIFLPMNQSLSLFFSLCYQPLSFQFRHQLIEQWQHSQASFRKTPSSAGCRERAQGGRAQGTGRGVVVSV